MGRSQRHQGEDKWCLKDDSGSGRSVKMIRKHTDLSRATIYPNYTFVWVKTVPLNRMEASTIRFLPGAGGLRFIHVVDWSRVSLLARVRLLASFDVRLPLLQDICILPVDCIMVHHGRMLGTAAAEFSFSSSTKTIANSRLHQQDDD
ncbi:hypothetical protein M8C21_033606 [Ambrosia artemisiifolia]|uniref:Uncharacterized protein n=1 Tax=Ambrosia artemisiifolia TaxID=4212 RepID=A0AAD5DB41_AMBAR|nr:hypothetical protein M8C21_033606 [Ambrosia artemisiifolia]